VTNQDIGSGDAGIAEQKMKIVDGLVERVEFRPSIAPGIAGAIIGADSRESFYLRLDELPIERERCTAVFDNYRWSAFPGAVDVELASSNIDHLTSRRRNIGRPGATQAYKYADHQNRLQRPGFCISSRYPSKL
jgi:hypothetical protein